MMSPHVFFLRLHKDLIFRLLMVDMLFFILTSWYLVIPSPPETEPIRTGVLVFLLLLLFTGANLRILEGHLGEPGFYRVLPISRNPLLLLAHGALLTPFLSALTVATILLSGIAPEGLTIRAAQSAAIFCTGKLMSLPLVLLTRKTLFHVAAFFLALIPIILLVLFIDELLLSGQRFRIEGDLLCFVVLLLLVEVRVLCSVR